MQSAMMAVAKFALLQWMSAKSSAVIRIARLAKAPPR
jgi:hypothetical protein